MSFEKFENSIVVDTDSYKVSMWSQYPPGTEYVYSYIESRGGHYSYTQWLGMQAFSQRLTIPITAEEVAFADEFWTAHGEPFNRAGWDYIVEELGGVLPLEVRSAPEGSIIPTGHVLATIVNTDPKCFWLTTWVETSALRAWYPTTVGTQSHFIKGIIKNYLVKSGDVSGLPFKLHDFGSRGVSSLQSAMIGCSAHLVNFLGTDTAIGILYANRVYGADLKATAFSIPASEHSTITSWLRSNEKEAYANMVKQFGKPGAIFAVVSDSYDIYNACKMWVELKDEVVACGGTLVIRPDSGDPVEVVPKMLHILSEGFGFTVNDKGYRVLNNVRIIWGDGINEVTISSILRVVVDIMGYSADNIGFGMGGALLQIVNRDTQRFAMKCSAIAVRVDMPDLTNENETQTTLEWRDVYKDPITDSGKTSKKGQVTLYKSGDQYQSGLVGEIPKSWSDTSAPWTEVLQTIYKDGVLFNQLTFEEVRANSNK
jgi:nicotinamide phosphoribosyltransferase